MSDYEARFNQIIDAKNAADIDSPIRRAFESATENAEFSVMHEGVARFSEDYYSIFVSSFDCMLDA